MSEKMAQVIRRLENNRSQRLLRNRLPLMQTLVEMPRISLSELRLVPPAGLEPARPKAEGF